MTESHAATHNENEKIAAEGAMLSDSFELDESTAKVNSENTQLIAQETNHEVHSATSTESHGEETHSGEGHHYQHKFAEEIHHQHYPAMILSLIIAGCGILFSFCMYQFKFFSADNMERMFKKLHTFSFRKWYFDEIYQATAVNGSVGLAKVLALFDNYVIDGLVNLSAAFGRIIGYFTGFFDNIVVDGIVNLIAKITGALGCGIRKLQTGSVQTYIMLAIIGLILLIYFVS